MPQVVLENAKILVIEDNTDLRLLLATILKKEKYQVQQAENGEQALDVMKQQGCPDLILLDLSLPSMDGPELFEKLKNCAICSNAKVILISGWDDLPQKARAMGAAGYIRKPIDFDNLINEVQRHT